MRKQEIKYEVPVTVEKSFIIENIDNGVICELKGMKKYFTDRRDIFNLIFEGDKESILNKKRVKITIIAELLLP